MSSLGLEDSILETDTFIELSRKKSGLSFVHPLNKYKSASSALVWTELLVSTPINSFKKLLLSKRKTTFGTPLVWYILTNGLELEVKTRIDWIFDNGIIIWA